MTQLVKYEAARRALAEARRVDEVKEIRDKAQAMAAYARQSRDTQLVEWATEIKVRAERRCGELLKEGRKNGLRLGPGQNLLSHDGIGLKTLGLTLNQSSRYQQLAEMPEEQFETALSTAKEAVGEVTTAHMLRLAQALRENQELKATLEQARRNRDPLSLASDGWQHIREDLERLNRTIVRCGLETRCPDHLRDAVSDAWATVRNYLARHLEEPCT
jgi:hypothetical protein